MAILGIRITGVQLLVKAEERSQRLRIWSNRMLNIRKSELGYKIICK